MQTTAITSPNTDDQRLGSTKDPASRNPREGPGQSGQRFKVPRKAPGAVQPGPEAEQRRTGGGRVCQVPENRSRSATPKAKQGVSTMNMSMRLSHTHHPCMSTQPNSIIAAVTALHLTYWNTSELHDRASTHPRRHREDCG